MKRIALFAAVAALTVSPALAQDHSAHAAAPAAATKFSLDTPVEALVADPAAKAVIDADLPGLSTHASYEMFKTMSLTQLATMAPDKMKPETLAKVQADLAAIK